MIWIHNAHIGYIIPLFEELDIQIAATLGRK